MSCTKDDSGQASFTVLSTDIFTNQPDNVSSTTALAVGTPAALLLQHGEAMAHLNEGHGMVGRPNESRYAASHHDFAKSPRGCRVACQHQTEHRLLHMGEHAVEANAASAAHGCGVVMVDALDLYRVKVSIPQESGGNGSPRDEGMSGQVIRAYHY